MTTPLDESPLGRATPLPERYDPSLLFPVEGAAAPAAPAAGAPPPPPGPPPGAPGGGAGRSK